MNTATLEQRVRERAHPLGVPADLDPLLRAAGSARVVLLGEATHGTREFYRWRAVITRRLVEEQGLRLVAVEGDWRPMLELNNALQPGAGTGALPAALRAFERWPEWMWRNEEFADLLEWLRDWNAKHPNDSVQVYGLDLYGFDRSLRAVEAFFRERAPDRAREVARQYQPLRQHGEDGEAYALEVQAGGPSAQKGAAQVTQQLQREVTRAPAPKPEALAALQDSHVVQRAEAFYRAMLEGGNDSWNVRAEHMWLTLQRLLAWSGPKSRAVVWAHNTHVGDARATDMASDRSINIGQLARQSLGAAQVFIVGFATYRGEVVAGQSWGADQQVLPLPPARPESWDAVLQRALGRDGWLLFDEELRRDPLLRDERPQRAVGVVYEPSQEKRVNYTQTALPQRFDAVLFISQSDPLPSLP